MIHLLDCSIERRIHSQQEDKKLKHINGLKKASGVDYLNWLIIKTKATD
jgi:hypothetical protein